MALEGLQRLVGGVEGCWAPGVWDGAGLSGWEVTVAWSAQDLWARCPPVGSQCGWALAAAALYFPYHFKAVCCLCVLLGHKLWMRGSVRSGEAGGLMTRERERANYPEASPEDCIVPESGLCRTGLGEDFMAVELVF